MNCNTLKDKAREFDLFECGPIIYLKLGDLKFQIDFVDARLFWHPWDSSRTERTDLGIDSLTAPTLLVAKMVTAIERRGSETDQRKTEREASQRCT